MLLDRDIIPQINATAGEEFRSSPLTDNIRAARSGYIFGATGTWAIWDWGATYGQVKQARAILEESKVTLDDDVRQVELEVQQAYSNLLQGRELIQSHGKKCGAGDRSIAFRYARGSMQEPARSWKSRCAHATNDRAIQPVASALYLQRCGGRIRSRHRHGGQVFGLCR